VPISNRSVYILHYVKQNIADKISADDLSAKMYMGKPDLCRASKQEFGLSPIDHTMKEWMRLAKKYSCSPMLSITKICSKAGFNNLAYFYLMFHQLAWVTPADYRTLYLN